MSLFKNRQEAGQKLAKKLTRYAYKKDVMVLALPRGGVPVAFEVATALAVPLDVLIVRKLGVPGHQELAMGAVASGGVEVLNEDIVRGLNLSEEVIARVAASERAELERREERYRAGRSGLAVEGKTVIVIDDGVATGATMRAAVSALRNLKPARLLVAVPTAAKESLAELEQLADEVVCLASPEPYTAVGLWYQEFPQTTDEEVRKLLAEAARLLA